jgi:Ca-activated chloride channel family protein
MVWQDRAKAFETYFKDKGGITFNNLYEALNGPTQGHWADLGGDPAWGLIKIGYTDPRESNSGMMLLMALANNYYGRATRVTGAEVSDPNFVKWLSTIANAMSQPLRSSSGTLMEDYVAKGPGSYDFVFVYEALAIEYFDKVIGRAGQSLRIVYPQYNLYSDHPLCLIDHPAITAAQRDAAHEFQNFLLSPEIQKLALTYGFRPSDLNIPIFGAGTAFDKDALKTAGISANVGQEIAIPDGDTINNLLTQWRRNFAG